MRKRIGIVLAAALAFTGGPALAAMTNIENAYADHLTLGRGQSFAQLADRPHRLGGDAFEVNVGSGGHGSIGRNLWEFQLPSFPQIPSSSL